MSEGSPTEAFGPYIVYEQLGVGGMAQVHRAVAASDAFQRSVALKRMLSHIAGSEDMVKSFVREARLASYLRHENVAQTYDLGRVGDTYFIVMELITGRNLREVLRHCGVTTGPMPVQFALNILNQVCDALDYAHNLCDETGQPLGIIHRDVSPSNVIVSETGVVKLIDFGIAKASGGGMQTMSGTLKGKFAYMAPEYIGGRIDARADLFAVGVIAHELLTNRPLFTGRDDIDTLSRVRDMQIAPPSKKNPQVPPEIDDIVMTALARDPERRWQHATALRTALTTLTKRLGLVASNAQVVQWLDWAFSQPPKQGHREPTEHDTDTDTDTETADKTADQPSISIEQETIEHRTIKQRPAERSALDLPPLSQSASQKVTLMLGDDAPTPPSKAPIATPPDAGPAQKPRSIAAGTAAPGTAGTAAARASAGFPGRVPASSAAPPIASRARSASAPPPPAVPSPAAHSLQVAPELLAQSQPGPSSAAPSAHAAADSGLAPAPRTIPIMSAAPAFPASRVRSPSAPPPHSFQAALQNLSASSAAPAHAAQGASTPPAPGFHASPPLAHGSAAPSSSPRAAPASPGHGFNPALASPSHGFPASSPPAPPSFNAAPSRASAQSLPPPGAAGANGPGPIVPQLNSAPFAAPRPSAPSISPAAAHDPARSGAMPREPAPRDPAPRAVAPAAAPQVPRPASPVLIAILVLLAAAGAAVTVYFVLPLLT